MEPTIPVIEQITVETVPAIGAEPPEDEKVIVLAVTLVTVQVLFNPTLPVPGVAEIIAPAYTPLVLVNPVMVALQLPATGPEIKLTVPVELIGAEQFKILVENGIVGIAGSIGMTFKLTVNVCTVFVVLVKFNVGF